MKRSPNGSANTAQGVDFKHGCRDHMVIFKATQADILALQIWTQLWPIRAGAFFFDPETF